MASFDPTTGAIINPALHATFDTGIEGFLDNWNVDASIPGQVTLTGPAGMMEPALGPSSGHGYGTYTVTAMMTGNMPGPALILWPGDNQWPGPEIDFAEVANDGTGLQYGALHWDDGGDRSDVRLYNNVQSGVFHDYQVVWEPGKLTYNVDGVQQLVFTDHVPVDYAHGGMDQVIGFLNTNPYTSLTVTQADYVPLAVAAPGPTAVAPPVAEAPVDWNALAAQATANFEATGQWFI